MPLATMLKGLLAFEPMFLAIPAGILFLSGFGMSVVLVLFIKQTLVEEKALHFRKIDKRREGSFVVTISPLFFWQRKFFSRLLLLWTTMMKDILLMMR
jgi:hypothetical protein